MRTTLDLEDVLLRKAKEHAAAEGRTLTRVIEDALRWYLSRSRTENPGFRLKLLARKMRLRPGVDISDRDSLYERMDGRD